MHLLYMVLSTLPLTVLPSSTHAQQSAEQASISDLFASKKTTFLTPEAAFAVTARASAPHLIEVTWQIAEGYYLYKKRMAFSSDTAGVQLGEAQLPAGEIKHDDYFGDMEVYHRKVTATVPILSTQSGARQLILTVKYQGCAEAGLCYNPLTTSLNVELPATAVSSTLTGQTSSGISKRYVISEQDRLAELIRNGRILLVLGSFFGIGLLLAFTPCVLPMIPILSGIIAGHGKQLTVARGLSLAMTYVQGMALTYAGAAVISVLIFNQAPQAFFQKPWMIAAFAGLFVVLALAMFGTFTVQLPASLQTRLAEFSNRLKGGTYLGTFMMGALSALIVTACVAPALIAALSVISQTGHIVRGAAALYVMGLGMGFPLLLAGASAGHLLPKVGAWMETIKSLFGVMFLGVAIYLLSSMLPTGVIMYLWAALFISTGYGLFQLQSRNRHSAPVLVRGIGIMSLIYGAVLLIGASSGRTDPLRPLLGLGNPTSHRSALPFTRIQSLTELDAALTHARENNRMVMLDFYADWCVSCKEMENNTFTHASVQRVLSDVTLLQVDVTANTDNDQALLKRFGIFGPPTIAFFVKGVERSEYRVVGYMPADQFSVHVNNALHP